MIISKKHHIYHTCFLDVYMDWTHTSGRSGRPQIQPRQNINGGFEPGFVLVPLDDFSEARSADSSQSPQRKPNRSWKFKSIKTTIPFILHQIRGAVHEIANRVVDIRFTRIHDTERPLSTNSPTNDLFIPHTREQRSPRQNRYSRTRVTPASFYHDWAQSFVLFLLLLQTGMLILDTVDQHIEHRHHSFALSDPVKDYCYLVIFAIYTLELAFRCRLFLTGYDSFLKNQSRLNLGMFFAALDVVAVVSAWINFILMLVGVGQSRGRQILAMLSAVRILRLVRFTAGTDSETRIIFQALTKAGSKLREAALLVCFFWLFFALVGMQNFRSSLKRSCVPESLSLFGIEGDTSNVANFGPVNYAPTLGGETQFCAGHLVQVPSGTTVHSWLKSDGSPGVSSHGGYICPLGMVCKEGINPYNNTVSFDNIFQSLELVFITFSANTFSALMYNLMDSDGLIDALYFAAIIVVMYFWLVILLVGIITSSIQDIREKTHRVVTISHRDLKEASLLPKTVKLVQPSAFLFQQISQKFGWICTLVITYNLIVQTQRSSDMSSRTRLLIDHSESAVTWILLFEISCRFLSNVRKFHRKGNNMIDLILAIVTSMMQAPFFKRAGRVYTWFTIFQIARSYRIFWSIPPLRRTISRSLSYFPALAQLCSFFFLLVSMVTILATQMFKSVSTTGDVPDDDPFSDPLISTLSMYQIFTGEDWTKILYTITNNDSGTKTTWLGAMFIIGWFILSSILILNMILSRISDNFTLSDNQKRVFQIQRFLKEHHMGSDMEVSQIVYAESTALVSKDPRGAVWRDPHFSEAVLTFLGDNDPTVLPWNDAAQPFDRGLRRRMKTWGLVSATKAAVARLVGLFKWSSPRPSRSCNHIATFYRTLQHFCNALLQQNDESPSKLYYILGRSFKIFISMSIVSQIIIICVATPLYTRQYFMYHQFTPTLWNIKVDIGYAILWTTEAVIKIIGGGLLMGPHAYLRGWNLIDAIVVLTSWIELAIHFHNDEAGTMAALVSSFKAFRVLRLLTINKKVMREVSFVLRRGSYNVIACMVVTISLLIPFAVYGLNLFHGQSTYCNDSSISNRGDCVGEGFSSDDAHILLPRTISKPWYSFDTFGQSLYTLFLIVSQEGWTDVLYWARRISNNSSDRESSTVEPIVNASFFVIFNFCGTVFVTALFASVMIQNYTKATGVAFLTNGQRAWIEQKRLFRHIRPSRRPNGLATMRSWKRWCFAAATNKKGKWQRFIVVVFMLQMLLLCIDPYPSSYGWEISRDILVSACMILQAFNIIIRICGLTLHKFSKRPWDLLSLVLVPSGLIITFIHIGYPRHGVLASVHFMVQDAILLLAIPYIGIFRNLLEVALASLPLISTLLVTWFVLILFFAIALTQAFGLTRFGPNESGNANFRNIPKALILLFRLSMGEGRTSIMEDFAAIVPPYCNEGEMYLESDCGNAILARLLFISWKILSTYLFTSVFISLVYESFSYVYRGFEMKSGIISRDDIRSFKDAWALVDPKGTGYIQPESLPRFTNLVTGRLNMQVYKDQFSIARLRESCQHTLPLVSNEIDITKLNMELNALHGENLQERRRSMDRVRMELYQAQDVQLGIPMQKVLMTFLYHSLISERDSLGFEEYLQRQDQLRRIDDALRVEAAVGIIRVYWCKRLLRRMKENRGIL